MNAITSLTLPRYFSVVLLLLAACSKPVAPPPPQDIAQGTSCALDGMSLSDYPGPKVQIHYTDGTTEFYCDTLEMFALLLKPEQQQQRITAVYTQDMASADWRQPQGHWIDARSAFYVRGSSQLGAMGPTFASFAHKADAEAFAKKFGGSVLPFAAVTADMADLHGGADQDTRM